MLENVETMFDGMKETMKKLKKDSYQKNMKDFRKRNSLYFSEMDDYMNQAVNKEQAAGEIAVSFVDKIKKHFTIKEKINGRTQADMNFFMIYYVFPAILLIETEDSKIIAETICNEWGKCFKKSKIGYTDYYKISETFREKIFGIF